MGYQLTLPGYEFDEAASALQKSIRRGLEEEAMFWAIVIEERYPWYLWKRLRITCCEDIEEPQLMVYVETCYRTYKELAEEARKKNTKKTSHRMFLAAAVLHMCRAKKSSVNSDFACTLYDRYHRDGWRLEVPDWALDKHTARGRQMGRTEVDFATTGGLHANEDRSVRNPYTPEYNRRIFEEAGLNPDEQELHASLSDAE
jgi:replication-associated recombination protein RarA